MNGTILSNRIETASDLNCMIITREVHMLTYTATEYSNAAMPTFKSSSSEK